MSTPLGRHSHSSPLPPRQTAATREREEKGGRGGGRGGRERRREREKRVSREGKTWYNTNIHYRIHMCMCIWCIYASAILSFLENLAELTVPIESYTLSCTQRLYLKLSM